MKKYIPLIIYIMFFIFGFFLMEKLEEAIIKENKASENIKHITTEEEFSDFMKSQNLSKAFVTGDIEAIEPIIISKNEEFPAGEYLSIFISYYEWDYENKRWNLKTSKSISKHSPFIFLGQKFTTKDLNIPSHKKVNEKYITKDTKYEYSIHQKKYENVTIYIQRNYGTINYSEYVKPENLEKEIQIKTRYFNIDFFKGLSAILYYSFITFLFIGKLKIDKDNNKYKKNSKQNNNPQDFNNLYN